MTLHETTSRAESLCARCSTTPYMNAFQPIAASAVEVCGAAAAANLAGNGNHTARMEKLAAFVVHETERAIDGMATAALPLSFEALQDLERFEAKLGQIRRAIERLPRQSKKGKLAKYFSFDRETRGSERELKALEDALQIKGTHTAESKRISPMELANFSIRAANAICDAPVLNSLKPIVGIAEIIVETAQTVKNNRIAALQLASHSSTVTKSITDHAATLGLDVYSSNCEALVPLQSVLQSIHLYLTDLQKPQRRITSWVTAAKEKDRIAELNRALDKALALFTSTNVLSTRAEVRAIASLVRRGEAVSITFRMRIGGR
ncbi:hypothetical protein C8R45DRAFT_920642 [Mycena sanguinolenta]|nr:hypothetical protein C8R45DRAFT_920642 [Mycena sanguinolenta]